MRLWRTPTGNPRTAALDGTLPLPGVPTTTGAPFSANAFYAIDCVEVSGPSTEFVRTAESGRMVHMHFCPTCGSTVFWKAEAAPFWIGVAVGAFADPAFAPPSLSVFEQSKHGWVTLDETMEHAQGLPSG